MSKGFISHCIGVSIGAIAGIIITFWYQAIEAQAERVNGEVASIKWRQNHFMLSKENLYNELIAQGIDFPEIVCAQAVLETEHFKSYACLQRNNLFGLRRKDGTYMSFYHWTESVAAYKTYIQKWKKPPNNYYHYLDSLGYAEDKTYVEIVKQIVNKSK